MKQKQSNISLTPVKVLASFVSQKVSSIKRRKKIINKKKKEEKYEIIEVSPDHLPLGINLLVNSRERQGHFSIPL